MKLSKFIDLIKSGFDIDFNVGEVFYSISSEDQETSSIVYLANELGESFDFENVESLLEHEINDRKLKDIIKELPQEEFFY